MVKKGEGHATPTVFQEAIGSPLRSELRTNQLLPRVLSRGDMLTIFLLTVFFIWDSSIQQVIAIAGPTIYLFWIAAIATFLVPGGVVTSQLNCFMPVNGSIYVWTHRALGSLWGFFAGFCAWFPGVLMVFEASNTALAILQNLGVQLEGLKSNWLARPWQQGLFALAFVLLAGVLSQVPLVRLMKVLRAGVLLCGLTILLLAVGGAIWLLQGHVTQIGVHTGGLTPVYGIAIYGLIILALFGVEIPFNMAAESKQPDAARFCVRWGTLLVSLAYLVTTFGVTTVLPLNVSQLIYTPLGAVAIMFGASVTSLVCLIFIVFLLCSGAICNISFARILFVAALDSRLPKSLARLNARNTLFNATTLQMLIVVFLIVLSYFIMPWLLPVGAHFTLKLNDITTATIAVIWFISMIFLFLDLPVLLRRYRKLFAGKPGELIAPTWVLYLACGLGIGATIVGLCITLGVPFDTLFNQDEWVGTLSGVVLLLLVIGLIGSAYPRLLSSLNEQTSIARENVRLYEELRVAHEKLSQLDQLKDAFLMTASHELRTPLTIVQGYLELLSEIPEEDMTPEMRRNFLHRARLACDELVLLQANIMDASTIQLDAAVLNCTTLSLQTVCRAVAELFEPLIMQEKRQMEIDISAQIIVYAEETRLKQVLRNLIANALRYSPEYTSVRIVATVAEQAQMVRTSVIDQGAGIPLDKQEVIFERFVRLERDTHGIMRGSGLGLAICRQLLEAMNGTISVESSGVPGEGSAFTFTLPTG